MYIVQKNFNYFNDYYVNVGPNLAKNIPHQSDNPHSYIKQGNVNTMYVQPTDCEEIRNIVTNLENASAGYDGIIA